MHTNVLRRVSAAAAVLVLGAGVSACAGDPVPPSAGGPGGVAPAPPSNVPESTIYGDGVTGPAHIEAFDGSTVGVSGHGELLEGDNWNGRLVVDERAAVPLGAMSGSEDMVIEITGNGVDERFDDSATTLELFTESTNALDAAAVLVLEAGVYDLTLSEFGGDATAFTFTTLTGTESMARYGSTSVNVPADGRALAIVDVEPGPALVSADAPEVDPVLHLVDRAGTTWSNDDNSVGLSNWRAAAVDAAYVEGPAVAIVEDWYGTGGFVSLVVT